MSSCWKEVETHDELEVLRIAGLVHYADRHGRIVPCSEDLPCPCGERTVPGLIQGVSLCQKHFNGLFYTPWGSPEHKEAQVMYNLNFSRNKQESK